MRVKVFATSAMTPTTTMASPIGCMVISTPVAVALRSLRSSGFYLGPNGIVRRFKVTVEGIQICFAVIEAHEHFRRESVRGPAVPYLDELDQRLVKRARFGVGEPVILTKHSKHLCVCGQQVFAELVVVVLDDARKLPLTLRDSVAERTTKLLRFCTDICPGGARLTLNPQTQPTLGAHLVAKAEQR